MRALIDSDRGNTGSSDNSEKKRVMPASLKVTLDRSSPTVRPELLAQMSSSEGESVIDGLGANERPGKRIERWGRAARDTTILTNSQLPEAVLPPYG
jgi:hypothetical protein